MSPTIFISRNEARSQDFLNIVKPLAVNTICQSLIDFSITVGGELPKHGWLFFYSQTGVDFFLKQYSLNELATKGLKIAAFGPKTGKYMKEVGFLVDFIGSGEAKMTAQSFLLEDEISNVCFVKGSTSKDSLVPLLNNLVMVSSIEVYTNTAKRHLDIPTSDILVFTSPLNLETYFANYPIITSQKVVVIGTSTALSALNIGLEVVHISSLPSLESMATLVVQLCETWIPT